MCLRYNVFSECLDYNVCLSKIKCGSETRIQSAFRIKQYVYDVKCLM